MSEQDVKVALGPDFKEVLNRKLPAFPGEPYASALVRHPELVWKDDNQEAYTLEYVNDKVVYIQHENRWVHDQPNQVETGHALVTKWGQTTVPFSNPDQPQVFFQWSWTADQTPVTDEYKCNVFQQEDEHHPLSLLRLRLDTPREANSGCGLTVVAQIMTGQNPDMVENLTIQMLDQPALLQGLLRQKRRLENQNQDQVNRSKQNVAPM